MTARVPTITAPRRRPTSTLELDLSPEASGAHAPRDGGVREIPTISLAGCAPPVESRGAEICELTERAFRQGLAGFDESQTLALILSRLGAPDPIERAEQLLARFGCMARVLGATDAELCQVVSRIVALDLRLFADATRRSLDFAMRGRPLLSSTSAVHAYLRAELAGRSREQFRVLFLDKANHLICDEVMGEGTVDHAPVYPREVMRRALELSASACCLAHNHPTGTASPSAADIEMTRQVIAAGKALGIAVHDHFLVAGDVVVSFRAQGLM